MIKTVYMRLTTAGGGAGTSTGSDDSETIVQGTIMGVYLKFTGSPATTDTTLKTKGGGPPTYNIVVRSNANTDGIFFPETPVEDRAGAAIAASYQPIPVNDYLTLAVAQANVGDIVEAWVLVDC